jgi:hypothetical protein
MYSAGTVALTKVPLLHLQGVDGKKRQRIEDGKWLTKEICNLRSRHLGVTTVKMAQLLINRALTMHPVSVLISNPLREHLCTLF